MYACNDVTKLSDGISLCAITQLQKPKIDAWLYKYSGLLALPHETMLPLHNEACAFNGSITQHVSATGVMLYIHAGGHNMRQLELLNS